MYLNAESVTVDSDEGSLTLEIESAEEDRITVNIHGIDLDAFYDQVKARIGPYLREKEDAEQRFNRAYAAEEEAREAYALSDPKHPDFHSIHADIWDARDGK